MSDMVKSGGQALGKITPSRQPAAAPAGNFMATSRRQLFVGFVAAAIFFLLFGGWAALAPLVGGAAASGVVSPDTSRRVVQHLEGGIIRSIAVREGQAVRAGDVLMTLEAVRAEATFSAREQQWLRLLVQRARLDALDQGADGLTVPEELARREGAGLDAFVDAQKRLFQTRRDALVQQENILQRQIEQLQQEITSIRAENDGLDRQLALVGEEVADKSTLLEDQLINKSDVLALQRQQAAIESNIAANQARIARTEHSIEETRLNLLLARDQFRDQVAEEGAAINNEIAAIEEELVASGDILRRRDVTSPVDGTVLNIRNQTVGGVIRAGEPILDIVPQDDELIILARLSPRDIDLVHSGLMANVHLIPFQGRNSQPLVGEVVQVAADSSVDEATGEQYFELRVLVTAEELASQAGIYLTPGMPAEVIVVTRQRTLLQYLFEPVSRTFRSAFVYD